MVTRSRPHLSSPGDGGDAVPAPTDDPTDAITGWEQGLAHVEAILSQLVADRAAAADLIRTSARAVAVDEAQARALAHVVGAAVRAALQADTDRAAARLEVIEQLRQVLPLRDAAADVLEHLGHALGVLRSGQGALADLLAGLPERPTPRQVRP